MRINARKHLRLLEHIVQRCWLMIFANKPPVEALSDPAALSAILGSAATFELDLRIVQELLELMALETKEAGGY